RALGAIRQHSSTKPLIGFMADGFLLFPFKETVGRIQRQKARASPIFAVPVHSLSFTRNLGGEPLRRRSIRRSGRPGNLRRPCVAPPPSPAIRGSWHGVSRSRSPGRRTS